MRLDPGNVLAAKMNAHRHQWNGNICAQPQSWACGADAAFRENYCAGGVPKCFHLDVFKPSGPRFLTPDARVFQAIREQPRLLDDQVLAFYGPRFGSQQGIASGDFELALYGLYRVKQATLDTTRTPHRVLVEPHVDSWAMLPRLNLAPLSVKSVPGVAYLRQMRAKTLQEILGDALEEISTQKIQDWTPQHEKQLRRAHSQLPQWLEVAENALANLPPAQELPPVVIRSSAAVFESALAEKLKNIKIAPAAARRAQTSEPQPSAKENSSSATPVDASESTSQSAAALPATSVAASAVSASVEMPPSDAVAIPELAASRILTDRFDSTLVSALSVAFVTKSLVILTGAPGAGKSWIASRLLDDPKRERTVIVPVASTWRGREDLLGYVNPINGYFEPTELTRFLCSAEQAWDSGDRRPRLVVFEEFNLSQPEHWLSDLLVRLEYEPEHRADRTVALGGSRIAGLADRACSVVLVPSLRFVATLNNDHTVKPLSPRVLDRAALIEVSSSGRAALNRAGVTLADGPAELIEDLNDLLAPRGAAFSVRSARSLQRAVDSGRQVGLEPSRALDLVLAQEVLSRVRLLAGDPRDEQLLKRLQEWSQKPESADLRLCAARIADWVESLAAGRDVFQA